MDPIKNFEQFPKVDLKKLRTEIRTRLEKASQNPRISPDSTKEIPETWGNRENIKGCALAHNLIEFKIMLEELADLYPALRKTIEIDQWLEHENAHMNVAEATGHDIVGYGIIFRKTHPLSPYISIQPVIMQTSNISWGPEETFEKQIKVLDAPREYETTVAQGDEDGIAKAKALLAKLKSEKK